MSNELVKLDELAESYSIQNISQGQFTGAVQMAQAMVSLERAITPEMMQNVMALQGSSLGFRTDKDTSGGYPEKTVKPCFIEATIRGLRPVGNEFNIIASRCYPTKEGVKRIVHEWPGINNLEIVLDIPSEENGQTVVPYKATWSINGKLQNLEPGRVPVRVNSGMIVDAIMGKAEKKVYDRIYNKITGQYIAIIDEDVIDVTTRPEISLEPGNHSVKQIEVVSKSEPSIDELKAELNSILMSKGMKVLKDRKEWFNMNHGGDVTIVTRDGMSALIDIANEMEVR